MRAARVVPRPNSSTGGMHLFPQGPLPWACRQPRWPARIPGPALHGPPPPDIWVTCHRPGSGRGWESGGWPAPPPCQLGRLPGRDGHREGSSRAVLTRKPCPVLLGEHSCGVLVPMSPGGRARARGGGQRPEPEGCHRAPAPGACPDWGVSPGRGVEGGVDSYHPRTFWNTCSSCTAKFGDTKATWVSDGLCCQGPASGRRLSSPALACWEVGAAGSLNAGDTASELGTELGGLLFLPS